MARSTFYYHQKALPGTDKHTHTKSAIRDIYDRHKGRYGYRRITATLRQAGMAINHKVVQRLMLQMQLKSLVRPKKYRSYRGAIGRIAPNLLERHFAAARSNEKWVTDVTEFNVGGEKLYLSPVLDLYNGEVIAFETARRPRLDMVQAMLKKAFARLGESDAPILHSDQGWHYQHARYRRSLASRGLQQSMTRKGNCLDNAPVESFFGTLKSEFFYLNKFADIAHLQAELPAYIEYYNNERIKMKLKGLSPVQYRTQPSRP